MSKIITYSSSYQSVIPFHPSDLTGGQLYLRKDQATPSSWISDIGTARDFSQGTATQQPTLSTNYVEFDGVNDTLRLAEANTFGSDTKGIMFFSGYFDGNAQWVYSSSWTSSDFQIFRIAINGLGGIQIQVDSRGTGGTANRINFDEIIPAGSYFNFSIESNGSSYIGIVNGVVSTKTVVFGADNGNWFNSVSARNVNNLAALEQLSGTSYRECFLNKIYYNNTTLTPTEQSNMRTFMSNPSNY